MKKIYVLVFLSVFCCVATAQERRGCNPNYTLPSLNFGTNNSRSELKLVELQNQWNPDKTYEQIVLLVDYPDMQFSMENPHEFYDRLFNEEGFEYADGLGKGSVAEYFRDQSNGMFNVQFDVYGPIRVNYSYLNLNFGLEAFFDAIQKSIDSLHVDYSIMDWRENPRDDDFITIRDVVIVSAGTASVEGGANGMLWPNTGLLMGSIDIGDGREIKAISASTEQWGNGSFTGIGTICHEYCHTLGLPDVYPTRGGLDFYSVIDDWDLMDGGNYTAWGVCPPNLTASEKYLLGWLEPIDIMGPMEICDLKPLQDGGDAYMMMVSPTEYYMLENRNRQGKWDRGIPGEGLVITYTKFDSQNWTSNSINTKIPFSYDIVTADGWNYNQWVEYVKQTNGTQYVDEQNRMYSNYLSNAAFPFVNDTIEIRECLMLPFPITNIQMGDDGTISFEVGERQTAISTIENNNEMENLYWYDLQGHRLPSMPTKSGVYLYGNKPVFVSIKQ